MARILVADHCDSNRQLLSSLCVPVGYDVIEAADGVAAFQQTVAKVPDLMITDVHIPGMDGLELTRRVRDTAVVANTSIILWTACVGEETIQEFAKRHDAYLLHKPSDPYTILSTIAIVMAARHCIQHHHRNLAAGAIA